MKITILSTAYPLRGGIAHFNGLLYNELALNHDVDVLTFKRQYPSFLFPGKSQIEDGDSVEEIPSEVIVDSVNPLNWIKIGKRIKRDAPDLIVFKYWMPFFGPAFGTISRIAKSNKKTKILVVCDNVIPHERKPGDKVFTKYFFNNVDYFITMSKSVQKDLFSFYPNAKEKLLFHPVYSNFGNPIDKDEAKKKLNVTNKNILLFFGFIREYKGLDVLLRAVALLKDKLDFTLVVAGEFYSNEAKYTSLVDELGLQNTVAFFSNFIPTNEVKYYFSACNVVVLPYKSATQSGIVQIANNFDKPMISTNIGGLPEIIADGKTGYLVEKENPQELANSILKYFNEKKEEEFVRNIKEEAAKYSWGEFVKGMMELVEE
jgi:glycosyltransferase involved in cell wall biosynthesis